MNVRQQQNNSSSMSNSNNNVQQQHIEQLNRLQQQTGLHNQLQQQTGQQNQLQQQLLRPNQLQMQMGQQNQLHQQMNHQNQLQQQMGQQNQLQWKVWQQNQLKPQLRQPNQFQQLMGQPNQLQLQLQKAQQEMGQQSQLQTQGQHNHLQPQQVGQKNQLQLQQMSQQSQLQQKQMGQLGSGNLSQSELMGQTGHLQMFSGEAAADSAAKFNLQNQFLTLPQENAGFMQGSQFHPSNSPRQSLPGMQTMGLTGSPNLSSQLKRNGSFGCTQQRMALGQLRQQLSHQNALASGQVQNMLMNAQISGLSQNGQPGMIQNAMSQQQWLKQMPAMSSANSSLHLQQQLASSQLHLNSAGTNAQQFSQILHQQTQMGHSQVQQQQQPQEQPLPQQLPHQQQTARVVVPGEQKYSSSTGSQPDATASGITTTGGSLSQGREESNHLLGRRKIQDLVAQMGLNGRLDPELEDVFLGIADNFIESVTAFSCKHAKHRKSSTLEAKDVLLHLEKDWNLTVPGYSTEGRKHNPDHISNHGQSNSG